MEPPGSDPMNQYHAAARGQERHRIRLRLEMMVSARPWFCSSRFHENRQRDFPPRTTWPGWLEMLS